MDEAELPDPWKGRALGLSVFSVYVWGFGFKGAWLLFRGKRAERRGGGKSIAVRGWECWASAHSRKMPCPFSTEATKGKRGSSAHNTPLSNEN